MQGFNTELKHKGVIFHIQTQDKGLGAQYVESLIYCSGKVLASRKTFYTSFLNSPDLNEKINQIIKTQHRQILKEISEGKFDRFLSP